MIQLNNLIELLYKKNNFLIETKADILYSNGYLNEALSILSKSNLNQNQKIIMQIKEFLKLNFH